MFDICINESYLLCKSMISLGIASFFISFFCRKMGGILSLGGLACCFTSQAAMCLCQACPSCKNSTSSRIMYAIILLLTTVVSCILLAPGLHDKLKKVPFCKDGGEGEEAQGIIDQIQEQLDISSATDKFQFDCSAAVGYLAVYRLCFIVTLFFLLMALIMVNVKTSNDPRAPIQNGEITCSFS